MKISRIDVYDGKDQTGFSGHVIKSNNTGKTKYGLVHKPNLGTLKSSIDEIYDRGGNTIFAYTNVNPEVTQNIIRISNKLELGLIEESDFLETVNEELDLKK